MTNAYNNEARINTLVGNGLVLFIDAELPKNPPAPPRVTYLPGCNAETAAEAKLRASSRKPSWIDYRAHNQRGG
jgi:hypothetical protein